MWQSMTAEGQKEGKIEHDPDFEPDESVVEQQPSEAEPFPDEPATEESKNGAESN